MDINELNGLIKQLKSDNLLRTKDISDTYHTFGELYHHRTILFSIICNQNKDIAWKSLKHVDNSMFDDHSFIAGIETPKGTATYHCHIKYWDMFHIRELSNAPEWDGHTPDEAIERLISLSGYGCKK